MKLEKIQPAAMPAEDTFTFAEGTVQGASVGRAGNCLFVRSARRYKLFTEGTDEILFLEDGRISARGSHEELLERSEGYREIYEMQRGSVA